MAPVIQAVLISPKPSQLAGHPGPLASPVGGRRDHRWSAGRPPLAKKYMVPTNKKHVYSKNNVRFQQKQKGSRRRWFSSFELVASVL